MSLSTTIATGTLLGGLLAVGVYATTAPSDQVSATVPVAPTYGPVPTPTVTQVADCVSPAKLEHGVCVTHKPGPTITIPAAAQPAGTTRAPAARSTSSASRPQATTPTTDPTTGGGHDDEHGDDEHDDHEPGDDHGGDDHDDD